VKAQIAKAPNNSIYYLLLAKALLIEKDVEQAEAAAQKAADLDKTNLQAWLLLGELQGARGSTEKAIATYQQSIQTNPRDVRAYVLLGELEHERGNWQMAREEYQKALQVQPDYPPAANNLAYLMLEHGLNTDLALSLAHAARRGLPASTAAADTLGWALYNKGDYRSAIDLLEEASKKAPLNANIHFHLGMAYAKVGNRERAKTELDRTLHIDPNYGGAGDIRQLLAPLGPQ
jgi:Flp pilus assembly protein TadD